MFPTKLFFSPSKEHPCTSAFTDNEADSSQCKSKNKLQLYEICASWKGYRGNKIVLKPQVSTLHNNVLQLFFMKLNACTWSFKIMLVTLKPNGEDFPMCTIGNDWRLWLLEGKIKRAIFMPGFTLVSSQKSWVESPSTVLFPLSKDIVVGTRVCMETFCLGCSSYCI